MRLLKLINGLMRNVLLLSLIVLIIGCKSGSLNYSDMVEKPTAKMKGDCIQIFLGYAKSPVWWVNPEVKIVNEKILITARISLRELPKTIEIKLPDPKKIYQLYWVDEDGKMTIILVDGEKRS